jgi:hypothetical protein
MEALWDSMGFKMISPTERTFYAVVWLVMENPNL